VLVHHSTEALTLFYHRGVGGGKKKKNPRPPVKKKDTPPADMTLDYALRLLSLPRLVGKHPETGEDITADLGRYGPYLKHGKQSASLETVDEIFEIGVNRAVTVIAEKKSKAPARGSSVIKELGEHPDDGKPVNVMNGRYGPYVKHNKINATIPKDEEPDSVTLERALELIAARAAKAGAGKKKAKKS